MPKLKEKDQEFLVNIREKEVTVGMLRECVAIWERNHRSTTTVFNPKRWGGKHMGETMQKIVDLVGKYEEADEDVMIPDVAELLAIVEFHDESKSSSANTETSTTSQIITALIQTNTLTRLLYAPDLEYRGLAPERQAEYLKRKCLQLLKRYQNIPMRHGIFHVIAKYLTVQRYPFKKNYLENCIPPSQQHHEFSEYVNTHHRGQPRLANLSDREIDTFILFLSRHSENDIWINAVFSALKETAIYQEYERRQLQEYKRQQFLNLDVPLEDDLDVLLDGADQEAEFEPQPAEIDHAEDDEPVPIEAQDKHKRPAANRGFMGAFFKKHKADSAELQQALDQFKESEKFTYAHLRLCGQLSEQFSKSRILAKFVSELDKKFSGDNEIEFIVRDTLLHVLERMTKNGDREEREIVRAILSCANMRSCVTVNEDTSNNDLNPILDEMLAKVHGAAYININTFKFIINNRRVLDDNFGRIYWDLNYDNKGAALHLETFNSREEMHQRLRGLAISVIIAYQKSVENDQADVFFEKVAYLGGNACIEGRMSASGVLSWAAQLSDNKMVPLIILPSYDEVLNDFKADEEKNVYQLVNDFFRFMPNSKYYRGYPQNFVGKCKQDPDYAPNGELTREKVADFFSVELCIDYPTLDQLIEEYKPQAERALRAKMGRYERENGSISAGKLARKILRILSNNGKIFYQDGLDAKEISDECIQDKLLQKYGYRESVIDNEFMRLDNIVEHYYLKIIEKLFEVHDDPSFGQIVNAIIDRVKADGLEECAKDDFYTPTGEITADAIALCILTDAKGSYGFAERRAASIQLPAPILDEAAAQDEDDAEQGIGMGFSNR